MKKRVRAFWPAVIFMASLWAIGAAKAAEAEIPFEDWLQSFRATALNEGVSAATFDRAMAGVKPVPRVIELDAHQPEFVRPIWEYLEGAVSDRRLARGRALLAEHAALFDRIEAQYGVDRHILVAIWGLESDFGSVMGNYNVFEALATLAWHGRRTAFGRRELVAALKIVERGDKEPERMIGSWAGAMGQTQFIPSTYLQYAVDGDGDGKRDLFDSLPDIFASTANYLARHGWQSGERWGQEVVLPDGFDYALAEFTIRKPLKKWRPMGVRLVEGPRVAPSERDSSIIAPAGHRGPAFVIYNNFRTIMRYNNATAYALAVGHMADRFRNAGPIAQSWPRDIRPLNLEERRELQELLNRLGHEAGEVDGIIGVNTRTALRDFQRRIGVPADGFASSQVLEQLRARASN